MNQIQVTHIADQIRPFAAEHDQFGITSFGTPPEEALDIFKDAGLNGLTIAPGLPNSLDANHQDAAETIRDLAPGDLSHVTGWIMHTVATGFTHHPGVSDGAKLLLATTAGEHLISSPISEKKSRSDDPRTFNPTAEVTDLGDSIKIDAVKMFASNFEISTRTLTSALTKNGKTLLVLLDSKDPQISTERIWEVPGLRSTCSDQVNMEGVETSKKNIILEMDDFLPSFMGESGMWTYGYLTASHLGGARHLVQLLIDSEKPGYDDLIRESWAKLGRADSALMRAAEATDAFEAGNQAMGQQSAVMLLDARLQVATYAREVRNGVAEALGLHGRLGPRSGMSDGESDRMLRDLEMALTMPPNRRVVRSALARIAQGLSPF